MIALCVVGVLLGKLQSSATAAGRPDFITKSVNAVVGSPAAAIDKMLDNGSESFAGFAQGPRYRERIRELEAQVHLYSQYAEEVRMRDDRIAYLEKLGAFPGFGERLRIKGRVTRFYSTENRATLNIGSDQQVRVGCPVVTGEGLFGVIQSVDKSTSQVRLITAPKPFLIGATVRGNPPVAGLLHGEGADRLIVEFSDLNAQIKVGDLVVTSGQSEKVMGDIEIGRVVQVNFDPEFGSRTAQVYPAVQFSQTREVYVLR